MRQKLRCVVGLSVSMFFAAVASSALAQATVPTESAHAELIQTLRSAHRLLVRADHDYDGHRAKAAEEVRKALKELGYQHKKVQPASGQAVGTVGPAAGTVAPVKVAHTGQPKVHEPQANSDAQLKQALQLLQGALPQMTGKHPKATVNVNAAVVEINTALGIK